MKTKPAVYTLLNIFLAAATVVGGVLYFTVHTLTIKAFASLSFVLLGAVNLRACNAVGGKQRTYAVLMVIGLFVAMLADIVLEIVFAAGAGLFAVGHIFYFAAYCQLSRFRVADLIPCGLIFLFAAGLILLVPALDFGGNFMRNVCLGYALILGAMLGKAFANCRREPGGLNKIILLGSFLFFFSDLMLLFGQFSDAPRLISGLCVNTYYPGQAVLGLSLLRAARSE